MNEPANELPRCAWVTDDPLYRRYHDREWGVPVDDDRTLFEFLLLESFQAGLGWLTVLRKRENFRRAFDDFDPERVAAYDETQISALQADAGIIRNRAKIAAAVSNAAAFLEVIATEGSFAAYSWRFVGGRPKINHWRTAAEVPATSPEAVAFSRDLKRRGFRFVGPIVVYAYMQASGMVMDHSRDCFRYTQLAGFQSHEVDAPSDGSDPV